MQVRSFAALLVTVVVLLQRTEAKVVTGRVRTRDHFTYLDKFTYSTGVDDKHGEFHWWVEQTEEQELNEIIYMFLDEEWEDVLAMDNCEQQFEKARISFRASAEGVDVVRQWIRPHVWYVVLGGPRGRCAEDREHVLNYRFKFLNPHDDHFSYDESWSLLFYQGLLVAFIAYLVFFVGKVIKVQREESRIHPIILLLTAAIGAQFGAIVFNLLHLVPYKYNGVGFVFAQYLGQLLDALSQLVLLFMFIAISRGWTISNHAIIRKEVVGLVAGVLAVVEVVLVLLSQACDGESNKFHAHESGPGFIIIAIRIALGAWFFAELRKTLDSERSSQKRDFYRQFALFAISWFAAFPLVMAVASLFAPYLRHKVVTLGVIAMQLAAVAVLSNFFFSTKGLYFKISTLSSSPLPSRAGGRFVGGSYGGNVSLSSDFSNEFRRRNM